MIFDRNYLLSIVVTLFQFHEPSSRRLKVSSLPFLTSLRNEGMINVLHFINCL